MVAAGSVLSIYLPWPMRALLLASLVASLTWTLLRLREAWIVRLFLGAKGSLEVETKVGTRETVQVLPGTLALPGLIVLAMSLGGKRHALAILPDAVGVEAHRQLRVWLKWRASLG
jgi:toxin CptA